MELIIHFKSNKIKFKIILKIVRNNMCSNIKKRMKNQ